MVIAAKPEMQLLFSAIAQANSEAELHRHAMSKIGEYFQAKRWRLFFEADFLLQNKKELGAAQSKLIQKAISIEHNPVLRYLLQRHSAVHDEVVLPPGVWRSLCPRPDHAHVLTGPIVQSGRLIGGIAVTRSDIQGSFDSDDIADLSALCLHMSSRLILLRTQQATALSAQNAAQLTPREREIADLVAKGLTNKKIGEQLWITENSVKQALKRMYRKLNVSSRTEMVAQLSS